MTEYETNHVTTANMPNTQRFAFIGFGEVGQRFARDLLTRDDIQVSAYDIVFDETSSGSARRAHARTLGVTPLMTLAEAINGAHYVISAVTADATERVAATAAQHLRTGQIFIDVNSASPSTKQRAAGLVTTSGADYLEAAVMAAVLQPGITVPILAGGPRATKIAADLNRLGMNITAVATEYGRASAMKLCRSIMIKGWEALIVDCSAAAKHWNVETEVFGSLSASYPSIDWRALAADMGERVATHGIRRSAEMHEAADMLADMGIDPSLSRAVADVQLRGARRKHDAPA